MDINFFFEDSDVIDLDRSKDKKWIVRCIEVYNKEVGNINFIFCSDSYLLDINKEYLNHDYYTDIITFDNCVGNLIHGDMYISVDRVEENANKLNEDFNIELHRVMIHGILHLLGLNDSTKAKKTKMTIAENTWLKSYIENSI